MKATLRYSDGQYLLTVDERPKVYNPFYDASLDVICVGSRYEFKYTDCHKIIASERIDGLPKIKFEFYNLPKMFKSEETNKGEYLEQFINTEVEYELINNEAIIKL